MKKIPLTRGIFAIVDDADFDILSQWKWHALKAGDRTYYAVRSLPRRKGLPRQKIFMHRVILDCLGSSLVVDHVDGDGLNNQRSNLRLVTQGQNSLNRKRLSTTNKSGYTGVYWSKQKNKWHALIAFRNDKTVHLGFFTDVHEAGAAVQTFKDAFFQLLST